MSLSGDIIISCFFFVVGHIGFACNALVLLGERESRQFRVVLLPPKVVIAQSVGPVFHMQGVMSAEERGRRGTPCFHRAKRTIALSLTTADKNYDVGAGGGCCSHRGSDDGY